MIWFLLFIFVVAVVASHNPKAALAIIGIVVGIAALVLGNAWFTVVDTKEQIEASHASISMTAKADSDGCPDPKHPVLVTTTNNSPTRTLTKVTFDLDGFLPNHSAPVSHRWMLEDDYIIGPSLWHSSCWSGSPTYHAADLIWRPKLFNTYWQDGKR